MMGSSSLLKLALFLGISIYVVHAQEFITPGDPGFYEFLDGFNFTYAWNPPALPQSLRFTVNGDRDAWLAISPVPDMTSRHYVVALNSLSGCGWPGNWHVLARDFTCQANQFASTPSNPDNHIISDGEDVEFTLTLESDGMSVTSGDGGSTLSLSFDGDSNGPLCTCCYIGVYSSFASPITWSFPDTENLVPVINLVGKDSIQSIVTDGAAVADRAIDGSDSTDVDDDTCAISTDADAADGIGPFWRVDLGGEYRIDQVVLFDAFNCPTCCPDDTWVKYGKHCYKAITGTTSTGTGAQALCPGNSNLASIHSEAELDFLSAFAAPNPLWIGLIDTSTDVFDKWNDGSNLDFTAWGEFQPDFTVGTTGNNEDDCVYLTSSGTWFDGACGGTDQYGHICKIRQGPVLHGLEVYVGSCDHTGTIDYNGVLPDIDDNNLCGTVTVEAEEFVPEELYGAMTVKCTDPLYGRYIYVYRPEGQLTPDTLTICEVQAFGEADPLTRFSPLLRFPMQEQTAYEFYNETIPIEIALYFNEGTGTETLPKCFRFDVTTVPNSAVTGSDFGEYSETFTHITTRQTCEDGRLECYSIEIPITDDVVSENLEYFTVNFFNVVGLDIGQLSFNPFRVNIQDNDGCFELARNSYTAVEPSSLPLIHKWVNITVIFRAAEGELPHEATGSVMLSTLPIDATAAADYEVYTNHLVEFGEGVRSINVPVGITDDRVTELNETFRVVISGPSDTYQLCGATEAIVTILDNDHKCSISQSTLMALESQGTLEVTVNCEKLLAEGASIGLSAQGISAVDGSDYRLQDSWVNFDGTSLMATFIIDIVDDDILEDPETFRLQLINGDGVNIGDNTGALVTITDDDASFSLEDTSFSASEGDASQVIIITVVRDGYLAKSGSVWIRTRTEDTDNAKPADASDFFTLNQEVIFESGDVEKQVEIRLIDDAIDEALVESFLVELYNPTNGVIEDPYRAEIFIYDDDDDVSEANQVYFYLGNEEYEVMESEDRLQVTVYRTDDEYPGSVILSTGYFSTPGDARASEDYVQLNQRLEFAAGETSKTATIHIIGDDNIIEGPKKFHVDLSFPLGGKIRTPGSATITIIDDDVVISFVDTQYAALEGDGSLYIPINRRGYMGPISVDAEVPSDSRGSAEEGVDFFAPDSTIFGQGESDALLHISIVDDVIDEATTESFTLELVDPANGQVGEISKVSIVIFDNDEEEESDGNGNDLGSTAITFIGLGVGFGLLALIALVAGIFICMRVASANRLSRSRQYLAPAPRPYPVGAEPRPYLVGEAAPPSYELRGRPYYLR